MTESEIEAVFVAAGRARSLVRLAEPSGRYRVVEPYMVFRSATGKWLIHLYQVGGYSGGGVVRGWKNPELRAFDDARPLEARFTAREEYNPFNEELFPEVVFAVPTSDGRRRLVETPASTGAGSGRTAEG